MSPTKCIMRLLLLCALPASLAFQAPFLKPSPSSSRLSMQGEQPSGVKGLVRGVLLPLALGAPMIFGNGAFAELPRPVQDQISINQVASPSAPSEQAVGLFDFQPQQRFQPQQPSGAESARAGFREMGRTAGNPQALKETLDLLKDPNARAEVDRLMRDPQFQAEVRKMMNTPEFRTAMRQAQGLSEELRSDPRKLEQYLRQFSQ